MTSENHESTAHRRRTLLKAMAGCGMMTNTSLLATLVNLQATRALAADNTGGYKALVCLFLLGGNDSYNMLAPYDGTTTSGEYGDYHEVRGGFDDGNNNPGGLALERSTLLQIGGPNGRNFGIHPGMPELQTLYNNNKLAFVSNVGSLNRPITRTEYNANTNQARPLGLFSHADHQRHWMTSVPNTRSQLEGWGGKMADLLKSTNSNQAVSMSISTNGVNLFQAGENNAYSIGLGQNNLNDPDTLGNNPATVVSNYYPDLNASGTGDIQNRIFTRNMNSLFPKPDDPLGHVYSNLLAESLANTSRQSVDAAIDFNGAVNNVVLQTPFDNEALSRRMRVIAKVIGAQAALGQQRQVFFVAIGGWDNHSNLIPAQEVNLPRVSRAVGSFYNAMVELGCENDVTLFSSSDFARTLGTNGQGSDHAWGSNQFVVGGSVDGGKIYGSYPTSLLNPVDPVVGNLNLGRGRMIPTTSVDVMAAELAMWFGISNGSDLETMLPQIREFYSSSATDSPLGMFV